MSKRSEALLRDIAALFLKYGLQDWSVVVGELERGNRQALADAIRDLSQSASADLAAGRAAARSKVRAKAKAAPRRQLKPATKPVAAPPPVAISEARAEVLEPVRVALRERAIFPTTNDLKTLYIAIGIKSAYPKRRDDAVEAIIHHLDRMGQDRYEQALQVLTSRGREGGAPGADDYARWFKIILDAKPDRA